jgi:hypothetical protein
MAFGHLAMDHRDDGVIGDGRIVPWYSSLRSEGRVFRCCGKRSKRRVGVEGPSIKAFEMGIIVMPVISSS